MVKSDTKIRIMLLLRFRVPIHRLLLICFGNLILDMLFVVKDTEPVPPDSNKPKKSKKNKKSKKSEENAIKNFKKDRRR